MQQRPILWWGTLALAAGLHGMAQGREAAATDAAPYAIGPIAAAAPAPVPPDVIRYVLAHAALVPRGANGATAAGAAAAGAASAGVASTGVASAGVASAPLAMVPAPALVAGAANGGVPDEAPFAVPPLAAARLEQLRGGTDTVWNDMKLGGAVTGNTAVNVATGANIITNGSFSNASGLPVAIQNSGANVLIQNATIINVQLQ